MVDTTTIAMICIVIGALFLIAEALSPGFFLLIPGAIFAAVGIVGWFVDDFFNSWQLLVVAVAATLIATVVTVRVYQKLAEPAPPETMVAESMVGREGVVIVDVQPGNLRGKVKIASDIWSATSETPIEAGTEIYIYAAEGVHVKVRPK